MYKLPLPTNCQSFNNIFELDSSIQKDFASYTQKMNFTTTFNLMNENTNSPHRSEEKSKVSTCVSDIESPSSISDSYIEGTDFQEEEASLTQSQQNDYSTSRQTSRKQSAELETKIEEFELNSNNSQCKIEYDPLLQSEKKDDSADKKSKMAKPSDKTLSKEDEEILLSLVVKLKNSWKKILKRFNKIRNKNVTLTILRTRYNQLTPKMMKRKGKFTHQEDVLLAKYFSEYGSDWDLIASHLKNRTPNMLKNRYYSHIRKRKLLPFLLDEMKSNTNSNNTQNIENQEMITRPSFVEKEIAPDCPAQIRQSVTYCPDWASCEKLILLGHKDEMVNSRTIFIPEDSLYFLRWDEMICADELQTKISPLFEINNL